MNWIFLDLETTSLRPPGEILEIGLVAVNSRLEEVAHWSSPIKPFHGDWLGTLDPHVKEMHSNSGLLGELLGPRSHLQFQAGGLPTCAEAEAVACAFVDQFGAGSDAKGRPLTIMCGAKVGSFDRERWLARCMPQLDAKFNYRELDTNFTFLSEQFLTGGPTEKGETRHRALDDARQSVESVRKFFGVRRSA